MNDAYLERWAANVSAWATIGLLLGGIVSCSFSSLREGHYFELVSTAGGVAAALLGVVVFSVRKTPPAVRVDRRREILRDLEFANSLFVANQINACEYQLMRERCVTRYS